MSDPLPSTEGVDPRYLKLDEWPSVVALDALLEAQMAAVAAVRPALPAIAAAAEAAAARLAVGGRLIYCGAGTSGRIGVQDGAELPPTFDWPEARLGLLIAGGAEALTRAVENAEDRVDLAEADMAAQGVGTGDVVIALAASGATPYALACLRLGAGGGGVDDRGGKFGGGAVAGGGGACGVCVDGGGADCWVHAVEGGDIAEGGAEFAVHADHGAAGAGLARADGGHGGAQREAAASRCADGAFADGMWGGGGAGCVGAGGWWGEGGDPVGGGEGRSSFLKKRSKRLWDVRGGDGGF